VRELEPVCRSVGHYRLTAFPGLNRLRLPKHIGKTTLGVGTYALVGKTLLGRKVFDVVAAVHRKQGRLLARVRRTTTASCTETSTGVVAAASVIHTGTTSGKETTPSGKETKQSAAPGSVFTPPGVSAPRRHKSPLVRAATFDDAPPALRPLLYALLAISIGLLAAAAVPNTVLPAGATAAFLSSKRAYLAAAGIWLLVVVAVITAVA
jgi:hypothetical protein